MSAHPATPEGAESPCGRELAGRHCSVDSVCQQARRKRMAWGLLALANWCVSRAESDHDDATTLTMLERKTRDLVNATNKAGWDAVADFIQPNVEVTGDPLEPPRESGMFVI